MFVNSLSVVTITVLLTALFSNLTAVKENINIFFCSDTLYLPSIYNDLFIDGNKMRDWHLNPAPNYFPDMTVYFILMYLTNNFIVSSFIFSFVQYIFLGFIFIKILRAIFPNASPYYNLLICALLSVFLLEFFFFTKDFLYVFLLMVNAYHTGAFIGALVCVFFSFRFISSGKKIWLLWILIVGFLMVISDRLFIVLYVAPVCVTALILYKRLSLKMVLNLVGTNIIFATAGLIVFAMIDSDAYQAAHDHTAIGGSSVIKEQLLRFLGQMYDMMSTVGFRSFTLYLFIVSLLLTIYVFIRSIRKSSNVLISCYSCFSIIFSLGVILAPMLSGKYISNDCIRYNIYPVYLAVLNLAVFLCCVREGRSSLRVGRFLLVGLNMAMLAAGFSQLKAGGLKEFFKYYPDEVRLVDELAEKENLKYGVGDYWDAKKITLFSKKGVKVYPVFSDIALNLHVANDRWFFDNIFNFVVLNRLGDTTTYKSVLKNINYVSYTDKLRLVKTDSFTYRRSTGGIAINIEN